MLENKLSGLEMNQQLRLRFLAHAGNVFEYYPEYAHPVVYVDEIHYRDNEQGYAEIGAISAVTRGAGQTCYSRAHKEVRERPFIARGPKLSERAPFRQRNNH